MNSGKRGEKGKGEGGNERETDMLHLEEGRDMGEE